MRITSSENNFLVLQKLFYDESTELNILEEEYGDTWVDDEFVVREGDDLPYLNELIGKSTRLKSLSLFHMQVSNSFRDGLAANKSIQELSIYSDPGEEGFRCLAPFFRNTNTLKELRIHEILFNNESMKSFASLLSQRQIKSLETICLEYVDLGDEDYVEFARALSMQPQLETLSLIYPNEGVNNNQDETTFSQGQIALGVTMKQWKSPCLKVLDLESSHDDFAFLVDDDGMIALEEGMANCSNLEHLNLAGNNTITMGGPKSFIVSVPIKGIFATS